MRWHDPFCAVCTCTWNLVQYRNSRHEDKDDFTPLILMYFHRKRWMAPLEDEDDTTPFKVPTLAGAVMAVHSKWFRHLGGYNFPLEFWGGDNIELGFRAWLCGSGAFTHPCSIVGHVYKPPLYTDVTHKQNIGELISTWGTSKASCSKRMKHFEAFL